MARLLEEPRRGGVAPISGVLYHKICACSVSCGKQDSGASGDFICAVQFATVGYGHVWEPQDVAAVADGRRPRFEMVNEETGDGVGGAWRGGKHESVVARSNLLKNVGEEGILENVMLSPPAFFAIIDKVDLNAAASQEGGDAVG